LIDIFCTSIVDHEAVNLDELTYLLSEYAGDAEVGAFVDKLMATWTQIIALEAVRPKHQGKPGAGELAKIPPIKAAKTH
jgi:hypothetical protein